MSTPLVKRAYNLGLKAVPNFAEVLSEGQIAYYEEHLDQLRDAVSRGFVIPISELVQAPVIPQPSLFKASETDLDYWLAQTQKFAKEHLGVEIDLRARFNIPDELPWKSVIPVFDPGNLDNRDMVKQALKSLGLAVYEETDVMKYTGSGELVGPTLQLIENSIRPNDDTMGKSPNDLRKTGKSYLRLRGYGLAFALRYFAKGDYLDPQTWTWSPEDRLSDGFVAYGYWSPDFRRVRFYWNSPGYRSAFSGARVVMSVSLKP